MAGPSSKKNKRPLSCKSCKLREGDIQTPKMEPYGHGRKGILIIGEAPGKVEDHKGLPWQGRTGRLLQRTLGKLGIDMFNDCVSINSVNCRPPNNRAPTPFELDCCREVVIKGVIAECKPHIIILLGASAVKSFLAPRWPVDLGGITKWRGWRIPDQDYKAWVIPTYHPSYVSRIDSREANTIWEQDFLLAAEVIDVDVPNYFEPEIHIIEDLKVLNTLRDSKEAALDYETTGLRAKARGHRIVCAAVAFNDREVYAFMMPQTKVERKPFIDLLLDPGVGKMAHNIKFEHNWTLNRYGIEIVNWQWDSMLAAHQLDNRTGVTNLKFQTYVNFGVLIKDVDVADFLYKKDDDGFNRIYDLLEEPDGKTKLLNHVALDAYYEYRLAQKQMKELDYDYLPF